jgi:hypothetical protein
MSRSWFPVVSCWLLVNALQAQKQDSTRARPDLFAWPGPEAAHFLRWEATAMYDANSLRNDLVTALWRGGTISRELRQRSEGTTANDNRAGYVLEAGLSYAWGDSLFGSANMRPRLSVAYHDVLGLRYADDLYHTAFFGNADHENDWAELGPSAFEKVRYQSFGFGFEDRGSRSCLMVHLVSGQDMSAARIDRADLFTATDGRYLRLELDGNYARSEDDGITDWRSRGIGAALSFRVNAPLPIGKRNLAFSLGVDDLGAIAWNDRSLRVPRDTTILYEGIRVEDVLDIDGVLIDRNSLQDTLGLGYEAGAFLRPLPTRLYASFSYECAFAMRYAAEADVRNLPGYLPHAVFSATHAYRNNAFRAEISFGGFGGWRAGLGAQRLFGRRFTLELKLPNVMGLASENARGRAVMLGASLSW